jgi:hypothetical protein
MMSLTLELPPETEAALRQEAKQVGVGPEELAASIVRERFETPPGRPWVATQEWRNELQAWIDSHDPNIPPLSDYAVSRESFYEDHL